MQNNNMLGYELICVIANYGLGSKIIRTVKENGISGGTIFLGKGTIKSHLLEFLGLNDIRKEIILIIADKDLAYKTLDELDKKFDFEKPNHGIAFSTSVVNILGSRSCAYHKIIENRGVEDIMYNGIFVIVDKGKAESVVDVAVAAGARGGTIINARGSGTHENNTLFAMAIEPEKEIALIISEKNLTDSIIMSIKENLKIDEPGNGILFSVDINKTYGLY